MSQDIQKTFIDLCNQVSEAYAKVEGGRRAEPSDTEPYLIALLRFVQSHPDQRDAFVQLFLEVANGTIPSPWFLLGFCMYELRYPEVREHLFKEFQDGYARSTFGRRCHYLRFNLDIFADQDPLFVRTWSYYNPSTRG